MRHQTILYLSILVITATSCKKYLQIPSSPDLISSENLFDNTATATAAVDGIYNFMRNSSPSLANGSLSIYTGLSSDELYTSSTNANITVFYDDKIPSTSNIVADDFWGIPYQTIYRCNAIIQGLQTSKGIADSVKKQLTGEMVVVRALCYFYLVNVFGDVPIVTSTAYESNSTLPRSAAADVYKLIVSDLTTAEADLTAAYPSDNRARPNLYTAAALLARVYLYTKDYPNAEKQATIVIGSGQYSLESDLGNVFLIDNNETIWQIATPNENVPTGEAANFIPYSNDIVPDFIITPNLLAEFDASDQRKTTWLGTNLVDTSVYYYPAKYKDNNYGEATEYEVVFRLAELYLIRAEALYNENSFDDCQNDLNMVRVRANEDPLVGSDPATLKSAITHENRLEFFCEWGHRWLDLKRTNSADAVLSYKPGWTSNSALFPIPLPQIQFNPALKQNPGY